MNRRPHRCSPGPTGHCYQASHQPADLELPWVSRVGSLGEELDAEQGKVFVTWNLVGPSASLCHIHTPLALEYVPLLDNSTPEASGEGMMGNSLPSLAKASQHNPTWSLPCGHHIHTSFFNHMYLLSENASKSCSCLTRGSPPRTSENMLTVSPKDSAGSACPLAL